MQIKIYHRRKMLIMAAFIVGIGLLLTGRLVYLMIFRSEYYQEQASALHEGNGVLRLREESFMTEMALSLQIISRSVRYR